MQRRTQKFQSGGGGVFWRFRICEGVNFKKQQNLQKPEQKDVFTKFFPFLARGGGGGRGGGILISRTINVINSMNLASLTKGVTKYLGTSRAGHFWTSHDLKSLDVRTTSQNDLT